MSRIVGTMPAFDPGAIRAEPMLFSADRDTAYSKGGPITRSFLDHLPADWRHSSMIIDSRFHELRYGMFPAIPGWHLDDVRRSRADGQPDHVRPDYHSEHICCIQGDSSRTRFIRGAMTLHDIPMGAGVVYDVWNKKIERLLRMNEGVLSVESIQPTHLVQFGFGDFHEGTAATHDGVRWFIRVSRNTPRQFFNEVRNQVQAYLQLAKTRAVGDVEAAQPIKKLSPLNIDLKLIRREPMVTGAIDYAMANGGPITRGFISGLPDAWKGSDVLIESAVFMMMPHWRPVIQGHRMFDLAPGSLTMVDGNYDSLQDHSIFFTAGNTFNVHHIPLNLRDEDGQKIHVGLVDYDDLPKSSAIHPEVLVEEGFYHEMNGGTLAVDQGMANGWQIVVRASRINPGMQPNRVRFQSQIHLDDLYKGW